MHVPHPLVGEIYEALEFDEMCTEPDQGQFQQDNVGYMPAYEVYSLNQGTRPDDPRLWVDSTLPYEIDAGIIQNFPNIREEIEDAIEMINEKLGDCISIRPKTSTDVDYVSFFKPLDETGCSSWVGRIGGKQRITLGGFGSQVSNRGCGVGSTVHEIFHALGLWHGQSRPDRDSLIDVHLDRIIPERAHNFDKKDLTTYGSEYDFNSLMHYGSVSFAVDGRSPTMTRKSDGGTWRANRRYIADSDEQMLRGAYCKKEILNGEARNRPFTVEQRKAPKRGSVLAYTATVNHYQGSFCGGYATSPRATYGFGNGSQDRFDNKVHSRLWKTDPDYLRMLHRCFLDKNCGGVNYKRGEGFTYRSRAGILPSPDGFEWCEVVTSASSSL
eukprot:Awhi_evm2s14128